MPKTDTSKKPMDPFSSLEQDHRNVEQLFDLLEGSKGRSGRWTVFLQIKDALGKHAVLEEHIVYPALRSCPAPDAQMAATEGYDEHEDIKGTLAEIEMTDPNDAVFLAKCLQLKALVAHHVEEEESEMFPVGRRNLEGKRLEDLGTRLESTRAQQASAKEQQRSARPSPQGPGRKR
jgi:hemerythrin superfamily protein